ncbi:helix-turn-helix domain-containing protein [Aeromonas veronii]
MSYLSFADKCGLTESGVRKYFPPFSSDPTLSRALAIANACGVSLEWLATGATTIPVSCGPELVESARHLQKMADSQWSLNDETRGHLRRAVRAITGEGE